MSLLFKDHSIVEVINLYIRVSKTKPFLCNAENTDKNNVNKQNTYTHQTLRKR